MSSGKVLVGGCFDILHYGHLTFLEHARNIGDFLVVILEPDERIRLFKQREPVHCQSQRAAILSALNFVDQVIQIPLLTQFEEYLALVKEVKPKFIAVTDGDPQLLNKQRQAEQINAQIKIVTPQITGFSTTQILKRLCS